MIELKDVASYTISSFNSTIPTGQKEILKVVGEDVSRIRKQMEKAGDKVCSLLTREVYYLVRGKNKDAQKAALVHGSFFETVEVNQLISQSFSQVLEDSVSNGKDEYLKKIKNVCPHFYQNRNTLAKLEPLTKHR